MLDLADVLGQPEIAQRLTELLDQPEARIVRLSGPAGSGKSCVARQVAEAWVEHGHGCVVAIGDEEHSARDLYPLLSGLSHAPAGWGNIVSIGARSALKAADGAIPGPGVATTIFELLSAAFRQRIERILKPYTAPEQGVILDLKRLARGRRLLVVADNAHWWDGDSLNLLNDLTSDPLREAIKPLASILVLLVDTADEQRVVAPDAFGSLAKRAGERRELIRGCSFSEFPAVLQAFGLTEPLPDDALRALFVATGGHLKVVEQVAAYTKGGATGALTASPDEYLTRLVAARFASVGTLSPAVSDLLARAAVLGLTFNEDELLCLTETKRATLRELISSAERIGFIERGAGTLAFSHDVIRSAILQGRPASQFAALHAKLADCLAILRPGDYGARAHAQSEAGEGERSREMLALSSVSQLRNGAPRSRVLRKAAIERPDDTHFAAYLTCIADGYDAVAAGDFASALPALYTPVTGESTLMASERNYLAALCSMELQTADGFTQAREILNSWIPHLADETELRVRFLMLLQQAQVLAGMFDEARESERRIEQDLLRRLPYDAEAAVFLQIQNRRATAVNGPTVASRRIHEAVTFFRQSGRDSTRDLLELFRSLNNMAAAEIRLGAFEEAHRSCEDAQGIALEFPETVRRLDCLASNAVLAALRFGTINASEAVARQRLVIESPEGAGDKFLHRCNLATYLLLDAQDEDAEDELRRLGEEIVGQEIAESYLYFYWAACSVGLAAVRGEVDEALRLHREMEEFSRIIRWPCAQHVRRRQALLPELLPVVSGASTRDSADRVLLDAYPLEVGPGWDYYARLFPCAELSFWSDS